MTQQQTTTHWTLDTDTGTVTLCEPHALEATNLGGARAGIKFETMEEATAILSALGAFAGLSGPVFGNSDGPCDECGQ